MKLFLSLLTIFFLLNTSAHSQKEKVHISYNQEDVMVLLDNNLLGENPTSIKVNYALNRKITFFKRGYYSHQIEIDSDIYLNTINIDLKQKEADTKLAHKQLLKPDTLVISKIVTNFTRSDLIEAIGDNFVKNNFIIGKEVNLFKDANNQIKDTKYKIAAEIIDSEQLRSVYKAPRFMMAQIDIRWSLLDVELNKVVYFNETTGSHLISIKKSKGYVMSKLMQKTVIEAIEEAQEKLITDKNFLKIILNNSAIN